MKRHLALFATCSLGLSGPATQADTPVSGATTKAQTAGPVYTAQGRLIWPERYREWIFLSSGIDMSYRDGGAMARSAFDNVFAEPTAYREFVRTGTWPDRTALVLEVRGATGTGSINKQGKFQTGNVTAVEVHVKDTKRFPGGWAFFAFQGTAPAQQIPKSADCYSCHQQHAAVDTTFVQFYPTLLGIATQKGTLSPAYQP
ncbi:MAG: Cytochrome [Gammaproteobacteria bacterium]|nr:Cytochrome [Gammaproteobacteria bacterium]